MRISGQTHGQNWLVWDCEKCAQIPGVVWVDDCLNQYARVPLVIKVKVELWPVAIGVELSPPVVVTVRKIIIHMGSRTVLVNPVADDEPAAGHADTTKKVTVPA